MQMKLAKRFKGPVHIMASEGDFLCGRQQQENYPVFFQEIQN